MGRRGAVHSTPDRIVQGVLRGMTQEQRAQALLGLCLRLGEVGWHYTGRDGPTWKEALKRAERDRHDP